MVFDLRKLQNGSDIRGIAIEGVSGEDVNLSENAAGCIATSFAMWLGRKVNKNPFELKICVGYDSRLSGESLKISVLKGLHVMGAVGYDAGLSSTPAMFMATVLPQFEFDGAIMITASHLPYNRNGFKFFTADGGLDKADIAKILEDANKFNFIGEYYEIHPVNVMEMYAAYLRQLISFGIKEIPGGLSDMHIIVDAGNGAGGFFAEKVLKPLGADVSGSLYLEPDGRFPNHIPNPENADALQEIRKAVVSNGADLGIIFDTDVDRSAAIGPDGRTFARNEIVALAAAIGAPSYPGGTVLTDSITSDELHEFLEKDLGLKHLRYKRGYKNVINKAKDLQEEGIQAFLAIETSGHAAFSDNYFLDDGAFLAVQIVVEAAKMKSEGKTIGDLISGLKTPAEAKEIRLDIKADDFDAIGNKIIEDLLKWANKKEGLSPCEENFEGARISFDIDGFKGWFLLRKSLHDPVMPLNIESSKEGGIKRILPVISEFIQNYPELSGLC